MPPQTEEIECKCVNCHFFCDRLPATRDSISPERTATPALRASARANEFVFPSKHRFYCSQNSVWDETLPIHNDIPLDLFEEIVCKDRAESCRGRYYRFTPGMGGAAARIEAMFRNERCERRKEAARDRVALWIAIAALFVSLILEGLQLVYQLLEFYSYQDGFPRAVRALVEGFSELR